MTYYQTEKRNLFLQVLKGFGMRGLRIGIELIADVRDPSGTFDKYPENKLRKEQRLSISWGE